MAALLRSRGHDKALCAISLGKGAGVNYYREVDTIVNTYMARHNANYTVGALQAWIGTILQYVPANEAQRLIAAMQKGANDVE